MKRKFIFRLIAGSVVSTTLFAGMPLKAKGEWRQDGQGNYYYNEGNNFSSGWRNIDGKIYYFNADGVMQKGWINYGNEWYFLDGNGMLKTGWVNYNNNWYYTDSAGRMQTGIVNINGNTYCLAENGVMQTKNLIIDGQFYTIGTDGAVVGSSVPNPEKIFDYNGNCIQSTVESKEHSTSPIEQLHMKQMKDESEIGDYDAPTRKFKVTFRNYNGEEIESKTVKEGSSVKVIDADSRDGFEFVEWNTRSDGSGKSYNEGDKVKATSDVILYPIYKQEKDVILVNSIIISGEKEVEIGKEIQLNAEVKPNSATETKVKWTVTSAGGEATIDSNGNIKGLKEGQVIVRAEAQDKSGECAEYRINVVKAKTVITSITITGASNTINENGGQLQLTAKIEPENASNKDVKWEIEGSGSKYASIDSNGVVTAIEDGQIDVIAHSKDGSGISSNKYHITISNQKAKPSYVIVTGSKNEDSVAIGKGTVQMKANVDKIGEAKVKWSVVNTDSANKEVLATIDEDGKLTGKKKGNVTVIAEYNDGLKTVKGTKKISVVQPVENILIKDKNTNATSGFTINTDRGILNFTTEVFGTASSEPNNKHVTWSVKNNVDNSGGEATINSEGRLTAVKNGQVEVIATANDGYGATTSAAVSIVNQKVLATQIKLYNSSGEDITDTKTNVEPLELICNSTTNSAITIKAKVDDKATDKSIKWSVISNSQYIDSNLQQNDEKDGEKIISSSVTITSKNPTPDGEYVIIKAQSNDGAVSLTKRIKIIKNIRSLEFTENTRDASVDTTIDVYALIHDSDATNKDLEWKVESISGGASIEVDDKPVITKVNGVTASKQKIHLSREGQVKVTVKAKDGSGVNTDSSPLIINIKPKVESVSIQTSSSTNRLKKGDSVELTATVQPDNSIKDVEWRIDGPAGVAELTQNGNTRNLVAKAAGTVRVVATARHGVDNINPAEVEFTIIDPDAETTENSSSNSAK